MYGCTDINRKETGYVSADIDQKFIHKGILFA